jgi:hypothetical protein
MIVRTLLRGFSPTTGSKLIDHLENDPGIQHWRSISPTPNCFFIHTVNELLNDKDLFIQEIIECRNAGYDIAWYSNSTCDITPHGMPVEYFEYQAGAYHENGVATESQQWNCIDKGLYQPGKTTKATRLAILKYLDEANQLHKLDYSLKVLDPSDPTMDANVLRGQQESIDSLGTTVEYFLSLNRTMDIDMIDICANGLQHYVGYPYQTHIYENTGWSLIAESNTGFGIPNPFSPGEIPRSYQDGPMISEKTYRPIMNSHPFVMVGEWGLHQHLNKLGYQTFEKFYGVDLEQFYPMASSPHPDNNRTKRHDYESIRDVVSQFYNNISANQDEVREMVTHNKQLLIANYNKTKQWLLDKDEYILGNTGDRIMNLHDFLWQSISYRNNNGKDLAIMVSAPERYLKDLDQLT